MISVPVSEHAVLETIPIAVLKTADRSNISAVKYREVAASLREGRIPCFPQLILGMPGDTLDKWKTCVTTMMEWGIHDHYWVSAYSLLPNAPAADPGFLRAWNVETIERELVDAFALRSKESQEVLRSRIVVSFNGYTKKDWVEALTYTAQIRGLHNLSITRLPAIYLHATHGIPYRAIYDAIIDEMVGEKEPWKSMQSRVRAVYSRIVEDAHAVDDYPLAAFPSVAYYVNPSKGVFIDVACQLDDFMEDLAGVLEIRFPFAREVRSVVSYQRQLVLTPHGSRAPCSRVTMRHDWPAYFAAVDGSDGVSRIPAPRRFVFSRTVAMPERIAATTRDPMDWLKHVLTAPNTAAASNHGHPRVREQIRLPREW